jgi:phosphoesterase RecJ-like protein
MVNNDDFQKAVGLINKSENILIATHTRPDGDACGSVAAICEALTAIGRIVKPLLLTELPEWYAFLFAEKPAIFGKDISAKELKANNFDLIILIDVNSENQLDKFAEYLKQSDASVLVIDHHVTGDGLGDVELVDTGAAASGLIVFELMKYADWSLTKKTAESLFVAISTDTGWFRFSNTDSRVHRAAAELIEAGVNPAQVYHYLYQNFSLERFRLMTAMLNTLEVHLDGRYATQHLTPADFEQAGAAYKDTENLVDECRRIGSVEVAALFVELKSGRIKCSLRSRGQVDVRMIAQKFGGGGHIMAAGVHLPGPLENAEKLILGEIKEQFRELNGK